jgi:hypothetical protein
MLFLDIVPLIVETTAPIAKLDEGAGLHPADVPRLVDVERRQRHDRLHANRRRLENHWWIP